ncbi:sporangiospore maturation cell wall hydrolase GsmA [Polymorphospora rubra]|uniref:sporangiospore maturation cell wall hydrolase GsmA n=1 Tax=Polymorphospora rubra TaxID=338584 RepID=UPI0033FA701A
MRVATTTTVLIAGLSAILVVPAPAVARTGAPTATVRVDGSLNVRAGASTADRLVGTLRDGTRVTVTCQVYGEQVTGTQGRSANWNLLSSGRYVADAYLRWTPSRPAVAWCGGSSAAVPTVRTGGGPLNVRAGAGTGHARVGTIAEGSRLTVECQTWGQSVAGAVRRSNAWNRLSGGRFVADAYVTWNPAASNLPWCGQAPPTVPTGDRNRFIQRIAEPARAGFRQYKVPASVTIAQAIQESGWGGSGLTRRDHNYFGIKCFGAPGPIAVGCRSYATTECEGNRCYDTTASFRAYRDATGSFADHGRFLNDNSRYRPAFAHSNDPDRFATEIHKAGYATSPTYATNLIRLMKQYDLYRYDR